MANKKLAGQQGPLIVVYYDFNEIHSLDGSEEPQLIDTTGHEIAIIHSDAHYAKYGI